MPKIMHYFYAEESSAVLFLCVELWEFDFTFFPAFSRPSWAITVMVVAWKNIKRSLFLFIEIYLSLFPSSFSEFRSKWKLFLIMILLIFEGRYFANFYTGKAAKEANDVLQAKKWINTRNLLGVFNKEGNKELSFKKSKLLIAGSLNKFWAQLII